MSSRSVNGNTATRDAGPLRFLIIGAGQRGKCYAKAVTNATGGIIHSVADPSDFARQQLGRNYIWRDGAPAPGQEFTHWRDWLEWEKARRERKEKASNSSSPDDGVGVDGVFICTLDEMHVEILVAIAPLNLHIMCEKPLTTSLTDTLAASKAITDAASSAPDKVFSIGHVLRYSPHNQLLRKLLLKDKLIGDIVSLEHTEPVGWSHYSHSYVRGNWRRETPAGDGSLLTKCCHDIDFVLWLLCSPPPDSQSVDHPAHLPKSISSTGMITQFNRLRKPAGAGDKTTNCLSCPVERECIYSAVNIYNDLRLEQGKTNHPLHIVCPDIEDTLHQQGKEAAKNQLFAKLAEDYDTKTMSDEEIASRPWYGRCVYESDNNVCDDQTVTIAWDNDPLPNSDGLQGRGAKIATIHMAAPTQAQCDRRGRVYGTLGEISYDSYTISVYNFGTGETTTFDVPKPPPEEKESHGGGDYGLTRAFVGAVDAVDNQKWDVKRAQVEIVGCTLEEIIRSHAAVFAAEEARRKGLVIGWKDWWDEKTAQFQN